MSRRISAFRKAAASDGNDHCETTVTETFAMAYAAGWIAREIGILPADWHITRAVMTTYKRNLYRSPLPRSFQDVLQEIAAGANVVQLNGGERPTGPFDDTNVFVRNRERATKCPFALARSTL